VQIPVIQAEMDQQVRNGGDISSKVKALSNGFEECLNRIACVSSSQASDMQHLKELGAQVAALWTNPSPEGSPRDPDLREVLLQVYPPAVVNA
jgi:hypothetical protein